MHDKNNLIIKFDNDNNDYNIKIRINHDSKLKYDILYNNNDNLLSLLKKKILDKKVISLSPGGIYGYYDIGTCSTLKKNFNITNTIYSGASAGSWNSIFMSYKYNTDDLIKNILSLSIIKNTSFKNMQLILKNKLCEIYNSDDFDLDNIYISVTVFENFSFTKYVYTNFRSLEDAVNCCIASSNIPFITGNLILKYDNKISFDGGFFKDPYLLIKKPMLKINSSMWGKNHPILTLFLKKDINELYNEGTKDSLLNIDKLKNIFDKENI